MDDIAAVLQEMRNRKVNHRSQSPTLVAWADRIEAARKEREAAVTELMDSFDHYMSTECVLECREAEVRARAAIARLRA